MISKTKKFQKTINDILCFDGVGLHSGVTTSIKLIPAKSDYGIKFSYKNNLIPATIDYVDTKWPNLKSVSM